jgi:putative intracellular protease/amidase
MLANTAQAIKVFLLLTDGFAEEAIVTCCCRLRATGLPVDLVGPSSGLLKGEHGLWIRPDLSLNQLAPEWSATAVSHALILAGGICSPRLMADPRVHRLIDQTLDAKGLVVILAPGAEVWTELVDRQANNGSNLMVQSVGETAVFVETLINRLLF